MGVTPPTIKLPEIFYNLLCEIGSVTQAEIDAEGKKLPSIQAGDTVKGELPLFGQQMLTLGKKKEAEEEDAVALKDAATETRLVLEMDTLFAMITLIISAQMTAEEICDDRLVAKICKGYQVALRVTEAEDGDGEDSDDDVEKPAPKTLDRKKMH